MRVVRLRRVSFGTTAAVVTSTGLVVGLASVGTVRAAIVAGLLIVGIADNLSDSLSVHIYQEAEGLDPHEAFLSTSTNFATRLAITATFVVLAVTLTGWWLAVVAAAWGLAVLGVLTVLLARQRHASVRRELVRHLAIAAAVIVISRLIGEFASGSVS